MKNILLGAFILIITLSFTAEKGTLSGENGKLSGVVTYKESYESSFKADAGSEIYAISAADIKSTQYDDITGVIENFQRNKSDYSISVYNTIDPARVKKLQDRFDTQSNFALTYINGFKQLPDVVKASANGTGNYTLNLQPGKYIILVVSKSVNNNNIAESKGKIEYKTVEIKSTGVTFLDVHFEKPENMLIMLLTNWQRQGC